MARIPCLRGWEGKRGDSRLYFSGEIPTTQTPTLHGTSGSVPGFPLDQGHTLQSPRGGTLCCQIVPRGGERRVPRQRKKMRPQCFFDEPSRDQRGTLAFQVGKKKVDAITSSLGGGSGGGAVQHGPPCKSEKEEIFKKGRQAGPPPHRTGGEGKRIHRLTPTAEKKEVVLGVLSAGEQLNNTRRRRERARTKPKTNQAACKLSGKSRSGEGRMRRTGGVYGRGGVREEGKEGDAGEKRCAWSHRGEKKS